MKYLIFIGLFIVGGIAGYFVGSNTGEIETNESPVEAERITEFIYDTIVERERVEVPVYADPIVDTLETTLDTLIEEFILDTLSEQIRPRDTTNDGEIITINRDEMIASIRIPIIYLETIVEKDSVIKDLLGIKENRPKEFIVQFWKSPLNFSGYKLSRNTVVLYGLSEQFDYKIYYKEDVHYLSNGTVFYVLKETTDFLPFKEVERKQVLND